MLPLVLGDGTEPCRILCLGAHADDVEIGCGGTLLALLDGLTTLEVVWVVLSARGVREREARTSAERLLDGVTRSRIVIEDFRDGFFPFDGARIKEFFERIARDVAPDVILTHHREDRHQDHRVVSDLTWQTFRDHLILEYEIPKYDGDLARPNCYVPLSASQSQAKIRHLMESFGSQRGKHWFTEDTFAALMRLRGLECASPSGYAEAFHAYKLGIAIPSRS